MPVLEEEVRWCYRAILGREPESDQAVTNKLKSKNFLELRKLFLTSPEFKSKINDKSFLPSPRLFLPPTRFNNIEYQATQTQLVKCLAHIKDAWSHLGSTKPHFSVITNEKFLPEKLEANINTFWESGKAEVKTILKLLSQYAPQLDKGVCVEYGCGCGRVTMELAHEFHQVHAYDISLGHINEAKKRAKEIDISNCQFHLCSDSFLSPLKKCDFFYSTLVFQHNPPPVIYELIKNALLSLKPGGLAIFQVPTYRVNYQYSIKEWLSTNHVLDMQMHCLPQQVVFSLILDGNCTLLGVLEDNLTGSAEFISNTFIVQKKNNFISKLQTLIQKLTTLYRR